MSKQKPGAKGFQTREVRQWARGSGALSKEDKKTIRVHQGEKAPAQPEGDLCDAEYDFQISTAYSRQTKWSSCNMRIRLRLVRGIGWFVMYRLDGVIGRLRNVRFVLTLTALLRKRLAPH